MNFVDHLPDDGIAADSACFNRTYDSHKGTDIAVADDAAMIKGVNVLAPLDGTVEKIRDGEPDRKPTEAQMKEIKAQRKECGNAIMIDHGDEVETIYCHLKKGSVKVKPGDKVKKGDVIAQLGQSGLTEFPHLHFGIIKSGHIYDPFTGSRNTDPCGIKNSSLWDKELVFDYQPLSIYAAGFSNTIADLDEIDKNAAPIKSLPHTSDLLAFWVSIFGIRADDKITIEVKDADGKIFSKREIIQPKTRIRQFYYTGRKLNDASLKPGAYTAFVTVSRLDKNGKNQKWNKAAAVLITP
ncbi:MAG TPA: M23 family metallopeptidase [Alphaproteobacteria bacterium]|nr:M23 family metallopeptidase [Alphaproteobacteria bacterium]